MSAVDQHAEAHRLKDELGYGARRIAEQLGVSRHAASRLLARPLPQPPADPVAEAVDEVAGPVAEAVAGVAVEARPVAGAGRLVAGEVAVRPTAMAVPVASGPCDLLVVDLRRYPGLAEDLELLQRSGAPGAGAVVDFAVDRLASAYRFARASGLLRDGQSFAVTGMHIKPSSRRRAA